MKYIIIMIEISLIFKSDVTTSNIRFWPKGFTLVKYIRSNN